MSYKRTNSLLESDTQTTVEPLDEDKVRLKY